MSCLHIWNGRQYLGTSFIRMIELQYELFCLTTESKKTINFSTKMAVTYNDRIKLGTTGRFPGFILFADGLYVT